MPTSCSGLFAERGSIGASGSPAAASTCPDGASTTALPACTLSTNPDRTTSTVAYGKAVTRT